jgi:hypothetical protein
MPKRHSANHLGLEQYVDALLVQDVGNLFSQKERDLKQLARDRSVKVLQQFLQIADFVQ